MKKLILLSMLIAALLCAADALAVPTERLLPESSYRQGRSYFAVGSEHGILEGRVDFAVYDTWGEDEYSSNPGSGRYVYAYQIFNDSASADPLEYFAIWEEFGNPMSGIESINVHDDGNGGIPPGLWSYELSGTRGYWDFCDGYVIAGAHSWFLVLSSDGAPVAGGFTVIKTSGSNDTDVPPGDTDTPEPASLALIGIGSLLMSMKKRKSRRL